MIKFNDVEVVISVSHVTEPGEGWEGKQFVAECSTIEELNKILNDPWRQPEEYWQWKVEFQDKICFYER